MGRSETIAALEAGAERIRALGATSLYLYGSAARDALTAESDVDVFIDYDPRGPFSFVELVRLQQVIGRELRRNVDLTTRNGLHPLLRDEIERTSIKVF